MITSWVKGYVCPAVVNKTNLFIEKLPNGTDVNLTAIAQEITKVDPGWGEDNTACDTSCTIIWSWTVAIFCIGGMMGGTMCGFVSSRLGRKGGVAAEQRGDGRGGGPDGPGEVCWQLPDADCWEGGDWYQLWAERWPGSHET